MKPLEIVKFTVLGVLLYSMIQRRSRSNCNIQRCFVVPGIGPIPENQLPSYGYVKYQGYWVRQDQLQQVLNRNQGAPWGQILTILLNTVGQIVEQVNEQKSNDR